jgi:hypothetical protein
MKTIKNTIQKAFFALTFVFALNSNAQSVAINTDGSTADASAILDLKSTNQGVLVPRLTQSQRTMIGAPATGLMVYQTDATAGFYFYNGSAWATLNGTNGTNGTNGATGTTGTAGTNGTNGQGVPTGGTANQLLSKVDGTNYNTQWVTPSGGGTSLPTQAGNTGKLLTTDGTNLSWTSTPILGSLQLNTVTSATSSTVTVTDVNVRTIMLDFQGGNPITAGTSVSLIVPSAASYPAGTMISFITTNTTSAAGITGTVTFTSPSSTITAPSTNNVSSASAVTIPLNGANARFQFVSDGVSRWFRIN